MLTPLYVLQARGQDLGTSLRRVSSMSKKWPQKEVPETVSLKRSQSLGTSDGASSSDAPLQAPQSNEDHMGGPRGPQDGDGDATQPGTKRPRVDAEMKDTEIGFVQLLERGDTGAGLPHPEIVHGEKFRVVLHMRSNRLFLASVLVCSGYG